MVRNQSCIRIQCIRWTPILPVRLGSTLQTDGDPTREGPGRPFLRREHQLGPVPHRDSGALYLRDDTHWLTAQAMQGPWTPATERPTLNTPPDRRR